MLSRYQTVPSLAYEYPIPWRYPDVPSLAYKYPIPWRYPDYHLLGNFLTPPDPCLSYVSNCNFPNTKTHILTLTQCNEFYEFFPTDIFFDTFKNNIT